MKKIYSSLFIILIYSSSFANIRMVPATYTTIQAALSACVMGDTVLVQPGTYVGHISWPNVANIKLYAVGDSSNTTISGNNVNNVISFSSLSAVDSNTVVRGFKITDGHLLGSTCHGGGIYISGCSPKFNAIAVTGNHIGAINWGYGAGVYCSNSSSRFYNSSIRANVTDSASWGYGGGVYLGGGGTVVFKNVKIENNIVNSSSWNYGTGLYSSGASATLVNCTVKGNRTGVNASWYYGTGIYFEGGALTLINVIVASNTQNTGGNFYYGAGIYLNHLSTSTTATLMNVTVTDNHKTDNGSVNGAGLYTTTGDTVNVVNSIFWNANGGPTEIGGSGTVTVVYSDVRNSFTGTGNILTNPLFASATDFHLSSASPCINAGTLTGAPSFDLENNPRPSPAGSNPDMGCYEISQPVGITEVTQNTDVSIAPNPFTEQTTITFTEEQKNVSVKIIDMLGKEINTINFSGQQLIIEKGEMKQGIYFVEIANQGNVITKKIIVQ